jgi:DNA-binding XRE family transcriptional regulator
MRTALYRCSDRAPRIRRWRDPPKRSAKAFPASREWPTTVPGLLVQPLQPDFDGTTRRPGPAARLVGDGTGGGKEGVVSTTLTDCPIMTQRAADRAMRRYLDARVTGRRLAWAREAAHVSQVELAAYIGVSQTTVSRVEHGERALRPAERAAAARALGRSPPRRGASAGG